MFRILALDGGGIKGTFTAAVLAEFEQQLGGPIVNHFDLIVGTSTGGIIALGLACGIEAKEILSFFKNEGIKIFPPARRGWSALVKQIFGPRYDGNDLKASLLKYLPNRRFMELEYNIAITSFDASNACPVVFKTSYHPSLNGHVKLDVIDVALATAAAPTYFAAADTNAGVMIDGGIWANCPVMVAITEALSLFRANIDDIYVLSIGTTSIPTFVRRDEREGGLLHWARPVSSLLMHAAKLGAIEQARKLCKELVRIDEIVEPGRFEMDDATQVNELARLGSSAGRYAWNKVQAIFFAERSGKKSKRARQPRPVRG